MKPALLHRSITQVTSLLSGISSRVKASSRTTPEHHLVLVTTALASEELRNLCESQDITLIAGSDLIDWIYELHPELPSDVRIKLGITGVPVIAF